jgi:pentatricopeptide repeat protein
MIRQISATLSESYSPDDDLFALEEDDTDQEAIEKQLQARSTIPQIKRIQTTLPQGVRLMAIDTGRNVLKGELDLQSLQITTSGTLLDPAWLRPLDTTFRGILVSHVDSNSMAWKRGIRPGQVVRSVSAGNGRWWPKVSLEGVRSALKASTTVGLEVEQLTETNVFELTLKKPLGFQIQETKDGMVRISKIAENAPNLVQHALRVGDRVVAIDSSLGDKLWPVSTVEGVISAVTGRIPGQSVTLRFERQPGAVEPVVATTTTTTTTTTKTSTTSTVVEVPTDHKELIQRCREVLQRYSTKEPSVRSKLDLVPALVADKVVEKLSAASVAIDAKTLAMLMHAYLSCEQPQKAIQLFEGSTGFRGDASSAPLADAPRSFQANDAALNLYTGTMLLQAHAQNQDLAAVHRVLAALEGRSGQIIDGEEVAPWPWTGVYGSIQPDTYCYNVALAAADQLGGYEAVQFATDLFARTKERDIVTYNTYLNILVKAGKSTESFRLFDQMKRSKVRPDKYTYYALMKSCKNNMDLQELFYDMKEYNIPIDVVFYNAMIQNLSENREWSQATKLIQEMETKGVSPQAMTYGILMNGMLRADKPNACLALFESACANSKTVGLTQNVHLYTTAIAAAAVLGNHERALELVSRMTAVGIKPNTKTLTSVVGACLASQKYDLAVDVYRKIEKPDGYAMSQGIQAFCGNGEPEVAASLLREQRRGTRLMSGKLIMRSYRHVIGAALEKHDYDLARQVLTDLLLKGYIPSKEITDTIVNSFGIFRSSVVEATTEDKTRFAFLLFAMDSLERRNLVVDGTLYAAALTLGRQIGGVERRVANLLLQSKTESEVQNVILGEAQSKASMTTWEEILEQHQERIRAKQSLDVGLPTLRIRVSSRNARQVFRAEQAVAFSRSKSSSPNASISTKA